MSSVTHVGLDVHKESTAVAVLRGDGVEPDHRVIASTPEAYHKLVGEARDGGGGVLLRGGAVWL